MVEMLNKTYGEAEDLINIGAYKSGSNPSIDYAIEKIDALNLPNFTEMGGLIPCARVMGGKPKYLNFIKELIGKIYED